MAGALSEDVKNETLMESLAELYVYFLHLMIWFQLNINFFSHYLCSMPLFSYTHNSQFDKAIEYNLRLHRPYAFDLIRQHNMFSAIKDKAMLLMESDEYLLGKEKNENKKATEMPAVQLLVQNVDSIPVSLYFTLLCQCCLLVCLVEFIGNSRLKFLYAQYIAQPRRSAIEEKPSFPSYLFRRIIWARFTARLRVSWFTSICPFSLPSSF